MNTEHYNARLTCWEGFKPAIYCTPLRKSNSRTTQVLRRWLETARQTRSQINLLFPEGGQFPRLVLWTTERIELPPIVQWGAEAAKPIEPELQQASGIAKAS